MQIRMKYAVLLYCILLFVFADLAYSQKAPETDRPHRHIGNNILYANPHAIYADNGAPTQPGWPVVVDWGEEAFIGDSSRHYWHPMVAVSDSILHVLMQKPDLMLDYYKSTDGGDSWHFAADFSDTSLNVSQDYYNILSEGNKVYTVWLGRHREDFNTFIYFKASSDYGQTWPITARIRMARPETDVMQSNIAGHGDTVFVSFEQAWGHLSCSRSFDMGRHWYNAGPIAETPQAYPPSLAYKAGVASIAFTYSFNNNLSVYYINSADHGTSWNQPQHIGLLYDDIWGQCPELAADDYGNIAVCWMDYWGSPYFSTGGIWVRISHDFGQTWEEPIRLDDDYLGEVGVTLAVDGNYVGVIWSSANLTRNSRLHYRESWDGGFTWGGDQILSTGSSHNGPRMVKFDDRIHLVWEERVWTDSVHLTEYAKYMRDDGVTGIAERNPVPDRISLSAYPNPFNSNVKISIQNYKGGDAAIRIYDISGRLVRSIGDLDKEGKTTWDATDNFGRRVSSGIYFAHVETPQGKISKKLLFLK